MKKVNILGLGPSWYQCPEELAEGEETWGANTMYRNRDVSRIYIAHDIRNDILLFDKNFVDNANAVGVPVYTSGAYPIFTKNEVYPIDKIVKEFNALFFLNVICYMIAHAVYEGFEEISLYGCDMRTDTGHEYRVNEKGAVEFWVGAACGRGIQVNIPEESYLCKRVMTGNFYGYVERKGPDGLMYLIPDNKYADYKNFRLTPIDKDGNDVMALSVTTELKRSYAVVE